MQLGHAVRTRRFQHRSRQSERESFITIPAAIARERLSEELRSSDPVATRVDRYLCEILRGELPRWPEIPGNEFESCVLAGALEHRVQSLIFHRASTTAQWSGWPEKVKAALNSAFRAELAWDLLRRYQTGRILQEASRQGIRVLLIKGEALAVTVYEQPGLRTRCDTDLFIDVKDIGAVHSMLEALGFDIIPPLYKRHQFIAASRQAGAASVYFDVHWRVLNASRFARVMDFSEMWRRSSAVPGMDGCRTPDLVDSLLLACMHRKGSRHHKENRLLWLYDLHLLFTAMNPGQQIDFANEAVQRNVQAACLDGVLKAQDCFHTQIPERIINLLAMPETAMNLGRRYFESNLALLMDDLNCLPDVHARLGLLKELFLPAPEALMRKYRKENRLWLPLLYLYQLIGGTVRRLMLK